MWCELDCYLSVDVEHVTDTLGWWYEQRTVYPRLSRMACDYLSVPATSVDVERLFSHGRFLLSHVRSHLSPQSIRALLCLGAWSELNLIKSDDVLKVGAMPDIPGHEEAVLDNGWDDILLN
ncbi:hypothetical protein SCLCIDRAFT_119195 [Scleroderma citrinum Foug A]|uniref:HAT C-terminal dimerisation domain-containing protein n=1 Tax=Scleroderma citrinum Foug A TaxID=1036808 RepID=A0A0C2ZM26_9AGAM|nr:hypothetical protein SCLCIDRAFT_119195 [Scleroderma citrinum Foug A]